jgi:hypothetical protein
MIAAVTTEFRKLFSTRMWWVLMLVAVGYLMFLAVTLAVVIQMAADDPSGSGGMFDFDLGGAGPAADRIPLLVYSMVTSGGFIFPLLVGVLSVTQEYRHKTVTPTFTVEPRRLVVLAAKLVASLAMGLAYGAACAAAAVFPAALTFGFMGGSTGLGDGSTWAFFGRVLLDFALWAPVGVGFGTLIHSQVGAIVVALAVTQLLEPILQMLPTLTQSDWPWLDYLPGAAGEAIQAGDIYDTMGLMTGMGGSGPLPWGWAALVLAGWAAVLAAAGYASTWRRDVS